MKLVNLLSLKEESTGAFGATSEELADMYSLQMLQQMRDEVMMDMEQQAEPEGGPIADMYGGQLNGLDKAIAIKRGETNGVDNLDGVSYVFMQNAIANEQTSTSVHEPGHEVFREILNKITK